MFYFAYSAHIQSTSAFLAPFPPTTICPVPHPCFLACRHLAPFVIVIIAGLFSAPGFAVTLPQPSSVITLPTGLDWSENFRTRTSARCVSVHQAQTLCMCARVPGLASTLGSSSAGARAENAHPQHLWQLNDQRRLLPLQPRSQIKAFHFR